MAKSTASSSGKGVPNKHLHARVAYLSQAATYLALQQNLPPQDSRSLNNDMNLLPSSGTSTDLGSGQVVQSECIDNSSLKRAPLSTHGLSLLLASNLRAVSLKGQVRLSHRLKRSLCKVCNTTLIAGSTSQSRLENYSKGGKKPWADVLVIICKACQTEKRFPVGSQRQPRKSARTSKDPPKSVTSDGDDQPLTEAEHTLQTFSVKAP